MALGICGQYRSLKCCGNKGFVNGRPTSIQKRIDITKSRARVPLRPNALQWLKLSRLVSNRGNLSGVLAGGVSVDGAGDFGPTAVATATAAASTTGEAPRDRQSSSAGPRLPRQAGANRLMVRKKPLLSCLRTGDLSRKLHRVEGNLPVDVSRNLGALGDSDVLAVHHLKQRCRRKKR